MSNPHTAAALKLMTFTIDRKAVCTHDASNNAVWGEKRLKTFNLGKTHKPFVLYGSQLNRQNKSSSNDCVTMDSEMTASCGTWFNTNICIKKKKYYKLITLGFKSSGKTFSVLAVSKKNSENNQGLFHSVKIIQFLVLKYLLGWI